MQIISLIRLDISVVITLFEELFIKWFND